jgi:Putative quorum-sensing-regulated virulence factor
MDRTIPFGRYRGSRIDDLPDGYLLWVFGLPDLRQPVRGWVTEEVLRRRRKARGRDQTRNAQPPVLAKQLVEAGFRSLARIHHPDVGGTDEGMRAAIEARAWLLERVERVEALS